MNKKFISTVAKFTYLRGSDPIPTVLVTEVDHTYIKGFNLNYASDNGINTETLLDILFYAAQSKLLGAEFGYDLIRQFPPLAHCFRTYFREATREVTFLDSVATVQLVCQ